MATVAQQQQAMFTGCGTCGGEFCEHGICRVCGRCTDCDDLEAKRPPKKKSALNPGEQQRLHQLAEERRQALTELSSNECPGCKRRKREQQSFCKKCFASLPKQIQTGLYRSFADGYMPFYRRAKEML